MLETPFASELLNLEVEVKTLRDISLQMIHQSGGQYLEAPVSGSKQPAEQVSSQQTI